MSKEDEEIIKAIAKGIAKGYEHGSPNTSMDDFAKKFYFAMKAYKAAEKCVFIAVTDPQRPSQGGPGPYCYCQTHKSYHCSNTQA